MNTRRPPGDFITLSEAISKPPNAFNHVIGVCVDFLPAAKSRGTDCTIAFVLHDPTWERGDRGMKFRFFHKKLESLPDIQSNGDVVILQTVATKSISTQGLIGISNSASSWIVLSGSSVTESKCPEGSDIQFRSSASKPVLSVEILQYAKLIAEYTDSSSFRTTSKATVLQVDGIIKENGGEPPHRVGKRRLLQDLDLSKTTSGKFADGRPAFADLFGEVRRMHKGDYVKVELYLTDYTSNSKLYNYVPNPQNRDGDEYGYSGGPQSWQGPWGKMTIHLACWDAHAAYARAHVREGMYVLVKNCQIKLDPNGSRLEATCRGDREDASKVNVVICRPSEATNDANFKDLLRRKREYEKMAAQQGLHSSERSESSNKKRSLEDSAATAGGEPPQRLSKSKQKRIRQNAKKQAAVGVSPATGTVHTELQSNQNVRCENFEIPFTIIDNILDPDILRRKTPAGNAYHLPFQNCRYKARVKVVDFFPDNIVDFAMPRQPAEYDVLSDCEDEDDQDLFLTQAQSNSSNIGWEWRFMLIVEDANFRPLDSITTRKQMALLVADKDAEYLLRETACNLRTHPQELATLKEKLFHLWGDLQERREEAGPRDTTGAIKPQSKPFECLIMEYGVPTPADAASERTRTEYQRMFKLFGTTI